MSLAAPIVPPFVHLHLHTEYSLLDGACRISDVVKRAKVLGMPALAISDHGNMFGAIEFYTACRDANIKPIIGCEFYLAPRDRQEREGRAGKETAFHQLLLATSLAGYHNLVRLTSIGYLEGFYYKPRIDKEVLRAHSEGLICTSTCLGGEIPQQFLKHDAKAAREAAETYLEIFGPDRFFIELQNHGIDDQKTINPELVLLARKLGVMTIATNDVHYLSQDDVEAHDVLCCISTRAKVGDEGRFKFETDQFYLKTAEEMLAALPEYPDALANTLRVAGMCDVEFDFTKRYAPRYQTPDSKDADDYLSELVYEGAKRRYGEISAELAERIDYELSVVASKGFSGYFLIVWDFVRYARENDIPASARGSGCSTVIGYCLGISAVDPLRYGLYFERFMDPERDEMPDIDIDLCQDRRSEVIDYVRRKYGHVAQIITFGRLKPRAAIRDVCRAMNVPIADADRVAKLVPEELKMTIDKALQREPDLRRLVEADEKLHKVIDISRRLEGLARHASVHAAGVVIADVPLDTLIPLHKQADSRDVTTQFEGPTVEKVGLLKMDFLGLRTLSQIHRACSLVRRNHDIRIDLDRLDLTDQKVFSLLARGETRGVFQFESGGMRDVLMKMRPNRIEDLIAANALYRPGPMEHIDEYCQRKHGKPWKTPHPIMDEVLAETYGIMVYQEQVSRLVNRLGDVPLRRAFRLAKAISKKKESMINAEREPFIEGCLKNGVKRATAEEIFADILKFGGYAFNKAHSAGYAVIAFQTAYLKTYYPVEFMAALLTYESGNTSKIVEYMDECRRIPLPDGSFGIAVGPPDVNSSDDAFTVVYSDPRESGRAAQRSLIARGKRSNGETRTGAATLAAPPPATKPARRPEIRFGLAAINGVGEKAVQKIREARDKAGRFRDIFDFCERVDLAVVNKGVIESLIKAGAFDSTGAMRKALMNVVEKAIELGNEAQRDARAGQLNMFGDFGGGAGPPPPIPSDEWSDAEMLAYEKATLGFFITRHPLAQYEKLVRAIRSASTASLAMLAKEGAENYGYQGGRPAGPEVRLGGLISKIRPVVIKQGRSAGSKMLVLTLEDFEGSVEAVVFPDKQDDETLGLLKPDTVVFIEGKLDTRREEPSIRAERIIPIDRAVHEFATGVCVRLSNTGGPSAELSALHEICRRHRGKCELFVEVTTADGLQVEVRAREMRVEPTDALVDALRNVVGRENVQLIGPQRTLIS